MVPDFDAFNKLASRGNLISVYKEILGDVETPVSAFLTLNRRPSFLLESVSGGEKWARYSFLGVDPALTLICEGKRAEIRSGGGVSVREVDDPLTLVKEILSRFKAVDTPGLPRFSGGFVGYIGYDVVKSFERVPDRRKPAVAMPDVFLMLTDTLLIFDNLKQTIKVVANIQTEGRDLREAYEEAGKRIDRIIGALRNIDRSMLKTEDIEQRENNVNLLLRPSAIATRSDAFSSNFRKEEFLKAVERTKEYVMSGDIVQAVLSQRFETQADTNPFDVYRALRVMNPSPYMYYLDTGEAQLVGASPEILVRLEGDVITLRPIAGTRKRGETEEQDRELEEDLKKDPKEVAEHIMLVDLGRNDVGRVAETGSVRVTDLMRVERYSHVMHLVSNVEARLKRGLDAFDVFRACFPAGTVSGAPKVRAMEIIEELEPTKRGTYAGAVGYFSYSGNTDTCITIRTLLVKNGTIYVQAGAGIVADSVPENEYMETVNKAMAMMKAVEFFVKPPK
ncbi:MAG: anthranilate synthase component I [Thermodesulfovibrionales bacterium]